MWTEARELEPERKRVCKEEVTEKGDVTQI